MNRARATKILLVLLIISIILTAATATLANNSAPKITGTSVSVLPANVIWSKTYGVLGDDDRAYCALPAGDGYLVVGSSESNKTDVTVGWALMLSQDGNAVWNKTFLEGSDTELRFALNLTDGFLLVGNEFQPLGNMNGFVSKIDEQGNLIWSKTIAGSGTDEFYSAFAATDGFVLLGLSSQNGGEQSQAWIVKIDTNGNVLWDKTYSIASDAVAKAGVQASDGSYVVSGYADPRGSSDFSFLLMKIDPNGNLVWNQTYGAAGSQEATAMTEASGGYVIVGNTQAPGGNMHAWVIKVDLNGTLLWTKTVGGKDADSPSCIVPSGDGCYLVGGFTFSFGAGNRDFWLFKINDSGQAIWSCTQGDAGYQEAYSVIPTAKNQCVMVGWTDPPGQPALIGRARYMFYVVNINYPKVSRGPSSLQFALYSIIACDTLLAILLVLFTLRRGLNVCDPRTGKHRFSKLLTQSISSTKTHFQFIINM
jgi:hypothetical protein